MATIPTSADANVSAGSASNINGNCAGIALTRSSLDQHTAQTRRANASRRGRSTPSSKRDIYEYRSDYSPPIRVQHLQRAAEGHERSMWEIEAGKRNDVGPFGPFGPFGLSPAPQTNHIDPVVKQAPSAEGRRYNRTSGNNGLGEGDEMGEQKTLGGRGGHGVASAKAGRGDSPEPTRWPSNRTITWGEADARVVGGLLRQQDNQLREGHQQALAEKPTILGGSPTLFKDAAAYPLPPSDRPRPTRTIAEQEEAIKTANTRRVFVAEQNVTSAAYGQRQGTGKRSLIRSPADADGGVETPAPKKPRRSGSPPRTMGDTTSPRPAATGPRFPPDFPTYHATVNLNEIGAYLANASYVVSMAGPPLANIKYGIIVVPAGEESLLFSPRRADDVFTPEFLDAIDDANDAYSAEVRLHDSVCDSDEFLRPRFRDDFPEYPVESFRNLENFRNSEDSGNFKVYPSCEQAETTGVPKSHISERRLPAGHASKDFAAPAIRDKNEVAEAVEASDDTRNDKTDQTMVIPGSETAQDVQDRATDGVAATFGPGPAAAAAPRRSGRVAKESTPALKEWELLRLRPRARRRTAPKTETQRAAKKTESSPQGIAKKTRSRPRGKAGAVDTDGDGGG